MAPPSYTLEDSRLVAELHKLSKKSPKLVRSSAHEAPADPNIVVRSWKMNEFKYYQIPSPFPTLARGLFTTEIGQGERTGEPQYRIVIRGYDKFFNIGEVPWTTWQSLESHTTPPYVLSLKSNGCIIFIAALTPEKLLITSKHSLGFSDDGAPTHARVGERWLRKYLADKGHTEADLASVLWKNNWTAVAELCDDSFEEHVLAYPPELTGLHLHGLNIATKNFVTLPQSDVDLFAEEWGFIKTAYITLDSIPAVREFTQEVGEAGQWRGRPVEGFVVRTHVSEPPTESRGRGVKPSSSPYAPGSSFFFKVKFDEPYMMYRDWREVTKALLSPKAELSLKSAPRSKMKRPETQLYVKWLIAELRRDRTPFKDYLKNRGIIANRERFLAWMASHEGREAQTTLDDSDRPATSPKPTFKKTIIAPVAIPGCGKTTVAVALANIFGFGHTQSDDIHSKKPAPMFLKNVTNLLKTHDVVIADKCNRNNHLRQHRQALRNLASNMTPKARLLALNWALDKPNATIHRICGDRVLLRGDNHQTLRADKEGKSHEEAIWMFINQTEELAATEVDEVVDMDLEDSPEQALGRAVAACVRILGLPQPTPEQVAAGLAAARGYSPGKNKPDEPKKADRKQSEPRYFAILAELNVQATLDAVLSKPDSPCADMWAHLVREKRVTPRGHVTLVHKNSLPGELELWERCLNLHRMDSPPMFRFEVRFVVWDKRVMALAVDDLALDDTDDDMQTGMEFISKLPSELRSCLHLTVGTSDTSVPPVEGRALVEKWRKGDDSDGVRSLDLENPLIVKGRIKGLIN
ncbi:hypothetical protein FISHEDRAFT_63330 [Fistulina hepatica ATCC 64428]|uniref:tRNA ligase n=1 Tax=Fistulina hepatica ATCC 64428 TaxID=1128425 RepID=A0A0D7ANP9_9AGAR|nr:hypothetical protein FISHEDRAFT_63330 [Fistulina hepatica ATCC 64428]